LNYQNNYVETLKLARISKFFAALHSLFLKFQQNYFDRPTNYFQVCI